MKLTKQKLIEMIQEELQTETWFQGFTRKDKEEAERAAAHTAKHGEGPDAYDIQQSKKARQQYQSQEEDYKYYQKKADGASNAVDFLTKTQNDMHAAGGKALSGLLSHLIKELDMYRSWAQGRADLKSPHHRPSREEREEMRNREKPSTDFDILEDVAEQVADLWDNDMGGTDRKRVADITKVLKASNLLKLKDRGFGTKLKSWFKGGGYNENLSKQRRLKETKIRVNIKKRK